MKKQQLNNQVQAYIQFYSVNIALSDELPIFPNDWLENKLLNSKAQIKAWHKMQKAVGFSNHDIKGINYPKHTYDIKNNYQLVTVMDAIELFNQRAISSPNIKKQIKVLIQAQNYNKYIKNHPQINDDAPFYYEFFIENFLKDYQLENAFWNLMHKLGYTINHFNNLVQIKNEYEYTLTNQNLFNALYHNIVRQ